MKASIRDIAKKGRTKKGKKADPTSNEALQVGMLTVWEIITARD